MMPTDKIAALRVQLAKKDRQIAKLKAQLASADERAKQAFAQRLAASVAESIARVKKEQAERRARREKAEAKRAQRECCVGCHRDTGYSRARGGLDEWYMVHNELWAAAGMTPDGGCLCIECLERRLGRQLNRDDFTSAPINDPDKQCSPRLRDRLQRR
jgi:hypothetical protein